MCLDNFEVRSFSYLILGLFCRTTLHLLTSDIGNAKNWWTFQLWVRIDCVNSAESLDCVVRGEIKKCMWHWYWYWYWARNMQPYLKQSSNTGIVLQLLRDSTAGDLLWIWKFFQTLTLLKATFWQRYFPLNFTKYLRTLILRNIRKVLFLMIWSLQDSFVRFIIH